MSERAGFVGPLRASGEPGHVSAARPGPYSTGGSAGISRVAVAANEPAQAVRGLQADRRATLTAGRYRGP
ncbi:hypothetical protein ACFYO0_36945 [Streptomyces sp. NPDC006365]|uniref:hypothetical protein n=1 Tax=Streptomyces sp. NPDC006365 TaxID=3364744 RepID=UPI003696046B